MKIKGTPPPKKVVFKTKPDSASLTLSQWWTEKDPDKAAAQMLSSAAYLKESQGYRYR